MYKILLVEDDFALARAIEKTLEPYGNHVDIVSNFQSVMDEFLSHDPQLVLMDIMLPFKDGYYWCAEIRKISSVPVVFISSASDNMNIVMAINMGADDFIAKPVDGSVLNAKVQAILRRTYEMNDNITQIEFHGATLNLADNSVTYNSQKIELTRNEFRILQILLDNKGKIISRDTLMMHLWQSDLYVEENTLSANVSRLRKKLEELGLHDIILTKVGSGYILP